MSTQEAPGRDEPTPRPANEVPVGLKREYEIYRSCADNGRGLDVTTGRPLKSFEEWLSS